MIGFDTAVQERACYKIYLKGLYIGTEILTVAQVIKYTREAVYTLKPVR